MSVKLEFKVEDLWIGAFWKTTYLGDRGWCYDVQKDIWICLLPCLPIHITYKGIKIRKTRATQPQHEKAEE